MPGRRTPAIPPYSAPSGPAQEGVDEGARVVARRRMDDEPGRLVDDQQVVVLVGDHQRDRLAGQLEPDRGGHVQLEDVAGADQDVRLEGRSVVGQPAVGDQALDVAPGQAGRVGHEAVGSLAARAVRHDERAHPGRLSGSLSGLGHGRVRARVVGCVSHRYAPDGPPTGRPAGAAAGSPG